MSGRKIFAATTSNNFYTTARSSSRAARTAITTTTQSFHRRLPSLHLELDPSEVFYSAPQLPD